MEDIFGWLFLAVVAALTYETPLFIAGLFGERPVLVQWWTTLSASGVTASVIIFVAAYIVVGLALWVGPLWYLWTILQPEGGAVARARTGAVLRVLLFPLMPLWDRGVGYIEAKNDARRYLKDLRAQYRTDFRDSYPTFEEFLAAVRREAAGAYADTEQAPPPPPPPPPGPDPLRDAEQLLGLKPGYTAEDLKLQHRALIRRFHPDDPDARLGSDIDQRINTARDTVMAARGWKK